MLVTMSDKELHRASVIQAVVEKRPLLAQSGLISSMNEKETLEFIPSQ